MSAAAGLHESIGFITTMPLILNSELSIGIFAPFLPMLALFLFAAV